MSGIEKFFSGVAQSILGAAIWAAVTFMIGPTAWVLIIGPPPWWLAILAGLITATIGMVCYQAYIKYVPIFKRKKPLYKLNNFCIFIEFHEDGRIIYKKRKELTCLKKGLYFYKDKYRWTGAGELSVKSAIPAHEFRETGSNGVWVVYEVHFQKQCSSGDELVVEVEWEMQEVQQRMNSFISATVEEPTESLKFEARLGPRDAENVIGEISSHMGANDVEKTIDITRQSTGEYVWKINKPKLLHHYQMRWF